MKTKTITLFGSMLVLSLLIFSQTIAQQTKNSRPANRLSEQTANRPSDGNYTYKLFVAPNKMFGYVIFRNGRIMFHQTVFAMPTGHPKGELIEREKANKAALMAIEKIKKGIPAELTKEELMQITTY